MEVTRISSKIISINQKVVRVIGKWKYKWILLVCFIIVFAFVYKEGSKARTPEQAFKQEMNSSDYGSYKILNKVNKKDWSVIFFTGSNHLISLGYFKKENNNRWSWIETVNCSSKWSGRTDRKPFIWCGSIAEPKYSKVFVEKNEADIVKVEGNKRVWFYVGGNQNPKIKAVLEDGSVEWFKEM